MNLTNPVLKKIRVVVLWLGVMLSWAATLGNFLEFYRNEGTIFKIRDCLIPNPITTPCFWGSLAFLGSLIFAYKYLKKDDRNFEKRFFYFMIFSIIFAWTSFIIEVVGVKPKPGAFFTVCKSYSNPFISPCFFGSILFTISFFLSYKIKKLSN